MVLSDVDIIQEIGDGDLTIEPYTESNVEPASIDLRLGHDFKRPERSLDTKLHKPITLGSDGSRLTYDHISERIELGRGDFVLATTLETVSIPDYLVAHVLGRSSLGRLGISVHQTAGYIDPGFSGQITLELSNHGPAPIKLSAEDRICQIVFEELSSPALNPYGHDGSQYQNQRGPTESGMRFD